MTLSTRNMKKTTHNHMVIKLLKISNKEASKKHSEKDMLYRGIIRTGDISLETSKLDHNEATSFKY